MAPRPLPGSLILAARRHSRSITLAAVIALALVVYGVVVFPPWSPTGRPAQNASPSGHAASGEQLRGLGFSPFRDCQSPELHRFPTTAQTSEDVDIIRGMGNALRTYSALNGGEAVVERALAAGLRVAAGAWLGPEKTDEQRQANRREIEAIIDIANRFPVESVIVGNEVLLRGDLSPQKLTEYIREVKSRVTVPVTTAEIASTATQLEHRGVMDAIDYLMAHIYPYWDGVDIDSAAWYVADIFRQTQNAIGKRVVIGETGWPSAGPKRQRAVPNVANGGRFLAEWISVAAHQKIDYYYFAAFDEPWKLEEGVGSHWGMYDADRRAKYAITSLMSAVGPLPPRPAGPPSAVPSPSQAASEPTPASEPSRESLPLYRTWPPPTDYVPSGLMGDTSTISLDDCANGGRGDGDATPVDHAVHITYQPLPAGQGWAGVYWQRPAHNWGDIPGGLDLRGLTALTFHARGERGGEKVTFLTGGITGAHGDTMAKREIRVTLTASWQPYVIDLRGADLGRVVGAFGLAVNKTDNPSGAALYLDDIVLDKTVPPGTPSSTPPAPGSRPRRVCVDPPPAAPRGALYIMDGNTLCADRSPVGKYEIGVDTSNQRRSWLSRTGNSMKMAYPAGQQWGAVFLTVGDPVPWGSRNGQNLAHCHTLQVDLRTDTPGAALGIGMKDKDQPDDGRETKIRTSPSKSWTTKTIRLTAFTGVQLTATYIIIEFVFEPNDPPQTVYFRNVRLLCH